MIIMVMSGMRIAMDISMDIDIDIRLMVILRICGSRGSFKNVDV